MNTSTANGRLISGIFASIAEFEREQGAWIFGSVHDLLTVVPQQFNSAIPGRGSYRRVREKIFGFFIQDDVRLSSRLTANLGVRYEPTTTMSELNGLAATFHSLTDPTIYLGNPMYKNWTPRDFVPRVGLAWDPTGSGKTAIRAGFGMFNVLPLPELLIGNINHTIPFNEQVSVLTPPSSSFPNQILPLLLPGTGMENYFSEPSFSICSTEPTFEHRRPQYLTAKGKSIRPVAHLGRPRRQLRARFSLG